MEAEYIQTVCMQSQTRKQAQSEKTRARLLAAGRALFAAKGYGGTATEEIVAAAGVSRGALYHQFADKRALFAAVFEEVAREVLAAIEAKADAAATPVEALKAGSIAFFEGALEPAVRRIYLIEGPAVLGWAAWREIDARLGAASLRRGVVAAGGGVDADVATHALAGAINEMALWAAEQGASGEARQRAHYAIETLIDGFFGPGS